MSQSRIVQDAEYQTYHRKCAEAAGIPDLVDVPEESVIPEEMCDECEEHLGTNVDDLEEDDEDED